MIELTAILILMYFLGLIIIPITANSHLRYYIVYNGLDNATITQNITMIIIWPITWAIRAMINKHIWVRHW